MMNQSIEATKLNKAEMDLQKIKRIIGRLRGTFSFSL
jgi:hypothetical protein